ncbi:MAG: VIT family protein [Candidatus Saccharibacteria bacterium]|nr:VIT family protein [Candidatus Saccharibacteria bacterium]
MRHNQIANVEYKLSWLRAAVLGADDGIVSIAGLLVGVASATNSIHIIFTAGIAGIIAGAISMAAGEFVSVSSLRDTEEASLEREQNELSTSPKQELKDLTQIYEDKGLIKKDADLVAKELIKNDPNTAHIDAEFGINPHTLANPWNAALASSLSYLIGAIVPLLSVLLPPAAVRIPFVFTAVILALVITGTLSAKIGKAPVLRAVVRVVLGGVMAMAITYCIGRLFGVNTV